MTPRLEFRPRRFLVPLARVASVLVALAGGAAAQDYPDRPITFVVGVRPDGKISLPLIGDLQASGLTPEKLGVRPGNPYRGAMLEQFMISHFGQFCDP